MATCGQMVETVGVSYPCDEDDGHKGPCACIEKPATKSRRRRWIADTHMHIEGEKVNDGQPHAVIEGRTEKDVAVTVAGPDGGPFDQVEVPRSEWSMRGDNPVFARPVAAEGRRDPLLAEAEVEDALDDIAASAQHHLATAPRTPTKQGREGDQPLPEINGEEDVQSLVVKDIAARRELGISRYGTALQPFNGRDVDQDLYEELLDATMYARQRMIERERGYQLLLDVLDRDADRSDADVEVLTEAIDILFPGRRA